MRTIWSCIGSPPKTPPCGAEGQYDHTAKTGDSGPAWQHTKTTGHATNTHFVEWGDAA